MKYFAIVAAVSVVGCGPNAQVLDEGAEAGSASSDLSVTCPPGPVPGFEGLTGTFSRVSGWPAAQGEPLQVTFMATSPTEGTDTRLVQGKVGPQAGGYLSMPDNPAIGPFVAFGPTGYPKTGAPTDAYLVVGLKRNTAGQISTLCLQGDSGIKFALQRLW